MSQTTSTLTPYQIQTWLVDNIAEQLGVQPQDIDPRSPMDTYGLDSAQVMQIISQAETLLGFQPSPLLLWHYPTVEALSQRLAEDLTDSDTEIFEL
jgi:acyl carrier protein